MTSHTGSLRPGDTPWRWLWEWCWLPYVAGPTLWLYSVLISWAREAPRLASTHLGVVALLIVLAAVPPLFWVSAYRALRRRWERRVCAVLYATALTLPVVFLSLLVLGGIGW